MTEAVQIALITGVCAAIPATAAAIFGVRSVKKSQKDESKIVVKEVAAKLDAQDVVAEHHAGAVVTAAEAASLAAEKAVVVTGEIHDLVNSRLTATEAAVVAERKAKEAALTANAELMAIVANQAKLLATKINGPSKP